MKQCNKSATVKFYMELLLTTTTRKQSRSGETPTPPVNWPPCITIHVGISAAVPSLLQVTKLGVSLRQWNDIAVAVIDIFNEKIKSCNHRYPDSVYFHTLFLIIYLSAIERLICRREMNLIGSTSFGFAKNRYMIFKIPY